MERTRKSGRKEGIRNTESGAGKVLGSTTVRLNAYNMHRFEGDRSV